MKYALQNISKKLTAFKQFPELSLLLMRIKIFNQTSLCGKPANYDLKILQLRRVK